MLFRSRSEQRFREVIDLSPRPMAIIDTEGRYTYLNQAFTRLFGYTHADIPNGRAWFDQVFPDPEARREAISTWKNDLSSSGVGQVRPRTFTIRCRNGEEKPIQFRPVTLRDGNQYITYKEVGEHQETVSES